MAVDPDIAGQGIRKKFIKSRRTLWIKYESDLSGPE
jgi:hypothetical protein